MNVLSRQLKLGSSTLAMVAATSFAAGTAVAQGAAGAGDSAPAIEEVVVTGTSIRGVAPVGSNVITMDQQAMAETAAVNVYQLLQTVTAISTAGGAAQGEEGNSFYTPQIHQIAGSASNATLVIVDGFRLPGGGTQGYQQTDPNIIPTSAIQRVEILADGASSIYGSDAVAGVVNFVTRKNYDGLQLQAQAGFATGYNTNNFGLLWGTRWNNGSVMVAGGYLYQSALSRGARPYTDSALFVSRGGTNFGQQFGCPTASMIVPGNSGVYLSPSSTTTVPNTLSTVTGCDTSLLGTNLPSTVRENALIKVNQDFGDRLSVTMMLDVNDLSTYSKAAPGSAASVTAYGPTSGKGTTTTSTTGGQINPFYQAPAGSPGSTSTETITWVDLLGNGPNGNDYGANTTEEETIYSTVSATYRLNPSWEIVASNGLGYNRDVSSAINTLCASCVLLAINGTAQANGSTTTSDISGQNVIALNTPLTTANALDVWDPPATNKTSAATLQGLYRGQTGVEDLYMHTETKLSADGDLFDMPAGPVKLAVGGVIESEHLINDQKTVNGTGFVLAGIKDIIYHYERVVYSLFAEFDVPLISPEMNIPFARKVDFDISGRYDSFSDVGDTKNPKFALDWSVVDGFKLRANYSTSFVAPPLGVLGDPALGGMYQSGAAVSNGGITVPVAAYPTVTSLPGCAGQTVSCTLPSTTQGLNRQLGGRLNNMGPQKGSAWSVGADIAPDFLPGFIANVTLFNTEYKGGATTPTIGLVTSTASLQHLLTICPTGCSAQQIADFTRVAQGAIFSGVLPTTVYFLFNHDENNIINIDVQGIDLQASYQFDTAWGSFKIGDSLTEFTKFDQWGGGNSPRFSVLNTSGINVTFPSIQEANRANLGWSEDALSIDLFWNLTGAYRYAGNTAVHPILSDANGNFAGGGDVVHANNTFDAHINYVFPDGWLSGDQLYGNVQNVFDTHPPYANTGSGYNTFDANILGRIVSVGLKANL
jgi:iron complex outermembrane receptor protein